MEEWIENNIKSVIKIEGKESKYLCNKIIQKLEVSLPQLIKYITQLFTMLLECVTENYDIIWVKQQCLHV